MLPPSLKTDVPVIKGEGHDVGGKKRGRRAFNYDYSNEEDYNALRGPVGPGDTYGIKMSAINAMAEGIIKQTTEVACFLKRITKQTEDNLQAI